MPDARVSSGADSLGGAPCTDHLPARMAPVHALSSMTQKAAAEIVHIPCSTVANPLHRIITRTGDGHAIRGLRSLGAVDISYCKGRKFSAIIYDLQRARVVCVGAGKGRETIDRFFTEAHSEHQRRKFR